MSPSTTTTLRWYRAPSTASHGSAEPQRRPGRASYVLGAGLAVVALVTGLATLLLEDEIAGPAAAVGCARGTALVVAAVATPLLVVAMRRAALGSQRALVGWLGAAGYLLYNAVVLLFATPYNRFFLLYVALLSLAVWSTGVLLVQVDIAEIARGIDGRVPTRGIAVYAWVVVVLNSLIWLKGIVPTITAPEPGAFLAEAGVSTQPVYIQDLAVWLPLMAVAAYWLWRGRPWGYLITSALLVTWVLEAFGIGVDQWFGSQADPASSLASAAMTPAFLAWAALGLVPVVLALRPLRPQVLVVRRTTEGI